MAILDGSTMGSTPPPGVLWPLQQLARGVPFDRTLHEMDVTPAIARVTWVGPSDVVDAIWSVYVESSTATRRQQIERSKQ